MRLKIQVMSGGRSRRSFREEELFLIQMFPRTPGKRLKDTSLLFVIKKSQIAFKMYKNIISALRLVPRKVTGVLVFQTGQQAVLAIRETDILM